MTAERSAEKVGQLGSMTIYVEDDARMVVKRAMPPEPFDHALHIVGRNEVVITIANFWKEWDIETRRDLALALVFVGGLIVSEESDEGEAVEL